MAQVKGLSKEKEPAASVTNVYLHVVEDVIQSVRDDFQSEGVDESVLVELRQLWELKMMQAGVIQEAVAAVPGKAVITITPVHDLNVPYEATAEYQTPMVELLFPPTPQGMTSLVMTPLSVTPQTDVMASPVDATSPVLTSAGEPIMYQYLSPGPSEAAVGGSDGRLDLGTNLGWPASYMQQPAPWMNQKTTGVAAYIDRNSTYERHEVDESGYIQAPITKDFFTLAMGKRKREDLVPGPHICGKFISQQDGAGDIPPPHQGFVEGGGWVLERLIGRYSDTGLWRCDVDTRLRFLGETVLRSGFLNIPQCDGIDDDYDDGVAEEDYNEPGEEEPQPAADTGPGVLKVEPKGDELDGGEPPLNEDDDEDELDDNDQGDEEPQTEHLVLAQFDKVTRSKNKWKCTLKDGIMHLNNKDILFVKATGEFEF